MMYVLVLAIVVFWLVFKDRPIMKLVFKEGELMHSKGTIPHGFLIGAKDIAHKSPFSGTVKVYKTRFVTKIVCSKSISSKVKQQLNNVYPHQGGSSKHRGRKA